MNDQSINLSFSDEPFIQYKHDCSCTPFITKHEITYLFFEILETKDLSNISSNDLKSLTLPHGHTIYSNPVKIYSDYDKNYFYFLHNLLLKENLAFEVFYRKDHVPIYKIVGKDQEFGVVISKVTEDTERRKKTRAIMQT